MAVITGRDCDLTIGAKSFKGVVATAELSFDETASEYQTLGGPLAGPGAETGTLSLTWAYDSGATDSLFDTLWAAKEAGTPVAYVLTVGSSKFTGDAVAKRPNAPAVAGEVSESSVELSLNGIPAKAAVTPPLSSK